MAEETKICTKCKEERSIEDFYFDPRKPGRRVARCKYCFHNYYLKKSDQEFSYGEPSEDGKIHLKIPAQPNVFRSTEEKMLIHKILKFLGWHQNKKTYMWYKPGLKDKNGTWTFPIRNEYLEQPHKPYKRLTKQQVEEVRKLYDHEGIWNYERLAKRYGVAISTIWYAVNKSQK